jgi:ureidoglycolate lyase
MNLIAQPLTPEAFAPYGEVITSPVEHGRQYFEQAFGNGRSDARASLSMVFRPPVDGLPLRSNYLERHEFSSQTFVPIDCGRWLIVVAPHAAGGGPDMSRACAFIAQPHQGVTYRMNTWHHGLTLLDKPGRMAVFMWRDGGKLDEEFVDVEPYTVSLT